MQGKKGKVEQARDQEEEEEDGEEEEEKWEEGLMEGEG